MNIRIPKKINSIEKKERLAETCFYIICENGIKDINSSLICDRSKVSVGTFYSYFKDKDDIISYSIEKYSKPILFPIYNNLNLLKFNKYTIDKTINKMINISLELHKMTKSSHIHLTNAIHYNENTLNSFKKLKDEELDAIYKKCLTNDFKDNNLKETIYTTILLINTFVHDKIFENKDFVDYDKQQLILIQTLLKLWSLHI